MQDKKIQEMVANNIRIERLRQRISQEKLAEMTGISTKYLNMIENLKSNPTMIIVIKICIALNIELNKIFDVANADY